MKKYFLFTTIIFIILLSIACSRDRRERFFEILYPNFQFDLPAGLSTSTAWGFELRNVASNFDAYLKDYNTDTIQVAGVLPFSARITSLDGNDYRFVEEVSVRICEEGNKPCTDAYEVFYIDDLRGRADESIRLQPTSRNVEKLLSQGRFRLDVVFFFRNTTPYAVESKLDMGFEAVK